MRIQAVKLQKSIINVFHNNMCTIFLCTILHSLLKPYKIFVCGTDLN